MKPVYDLVPEDFLSCRVWYFPMDGVDGGDEMSVRPASELKKQTSHQLLVATEFHLASGETCGGYIYWATGGVGVELVKPVMWLRGLTVTFWNGIRAPSLEYLAKVSEILPFGAWPIRFTATRSAGLTLRGSLEGIYFLDSDRVRVIVP